MLPLIVPCGGEVLGRALIRNQIWICWNKIHTVVCTILFSEFCYTTISSETVQVLSLLILSSCFLRRTLHTVTSNVQVQASYWPNTLQHCLDGKPQLGFNIKVNSFFLTWKKALLYSSMFSHLKFHLTAKALLSNMYTQLPFMSHLSYSCFLLNAFHVCSILNCCVRMICKTWCY